MSVAVSTYEVEVDEHGLSHPEGRQGLRPRVLEALGDEDHEVRVEVFVRRAPASEEVGVPVAFEARERSRRERGGLTRAGSPARSRKSSRDADSPHRRGR